MRSLVLAAAAIAALGIGGWYVVEWMPNQAAAAATSMASRKADRADHPQQIRSLRLAGERLPTTLLGAKLSTKIGDTLDLARLAADRQVLRDAMLARGCWAADVSGPEIAFGDDGGAHVSFRIVQGPVFRVRGVTIAGDAATSAALRTELTLAEGDDVSPDRLARNAELLTSYLQRHGSPGARVTVETATDRDARAVDVTFVVTSGG
jgi:outer membrane protein assembly factor BamA